MKQHAIFIKALLAMMGVMLSAAASADFHIKQSVVNSSGAVVTLPSYRLANVIGQGSPVGRSTAATYKHIYGYVPRVPWIDNDGDGMYSGWEIANSLDQYVASDAFTDGDADGLINIREFLAGTSPGNPDSDGDTKLDGNDAFPMNAAQWNYLLDSIFKGALMKGNVEAQ